jgi:hypothetical protein
MDHDHCWYCAEINHKTIPRDRYGYLCVNCADRMVSAAVLPEEFIKMGTRVYNCLILHGITTVEEVQKLSDPQLLRLPNLGKVSLLRIRQCTSRPTASYHWWGVLF